MTPQTLMRSRVNTAFLVMTLTIAMQWVVAMPTSLVMTLQQMGIHIPSYYTDFVLLQFLYPVGNGIMVLLALRLIRMPIRRLVTVKAPKADFIPWLGVFLGVTVVMNYTVLWMMDLLEQMGIHIPDVFASYNPSDLPQAVCYFIVLAILPPISEEILCRAAVTGLLKNFHPWTAVLISSFAFGWMHATVQQIPFAFALGVVLGFVYVKTGNLLYPILFHFVNNAWACALTYLSVWADDTVASAVGYGGDILFLLFGIGSVIFLSVKKRFTLNEIPHSLSAAEARQAVVKSPCFWIFTGAYAGMAWLTLWALTYQEATAISL